MLLKKGPQIFCAGLLRALPRIPPGAPIFLAEATFSVWPLVEADVGPLSLILGLTLLGNESLFECLECLRGLERPPWTVTVYAGIRLAS